MPRRTVAVTGLGALLLSTLALPLLAAPGARASLGPVVPATLHAPLVIPGGDIVSQSDKARVGDVNGDGTPDLVWFGYAFGNEVDVHVELSLSALTDSVVTPISSYQPNDVTELDLSDYNGDGRADLLYDDATGFPSHWKLMTSKGDGTFNDPVVVGTAPAGTPVRGNPGASAPPTFFAFDLTADGTALELVQLTWNASTTTFDRAVVLDQATTATINNGNEAGFLVTPLSPGAPPSLVFGSGRTLVNHGSGSFTLGAPVSWAGGAATTPPLVADFDGDGKPDLACLCDGGDPLASELIVKKGDGAGGFGAPVATSRIVATANRANAPYLHDLNGDGKTDIVVADGQGHGTWVYLSGAGGYTGRRYAIGDFRTPQAVVLPGATVPDLVWPYQIVKNLGDGTFDAPAADPQALASWIQPIARYDGHRAEVLLTDDVDSRTSLLHSGADPAAPLTGRSASIVPGTVAVGDINGDGRPDLMDAHSYGGPVILPYLNNGDGTFTLEPQLPLLDAAHAGQSLFGVTQPVLADVNGDGRPDYLSRVTPWTPSPSGNTYTYDKFQDAARTTVIISDGHGGSTSTTNYENAPLAAVADVTGDGKPDLVGFEGVPQTVGGSTFSQAVLVVSTGDGAGHFAPDAIEVATPFENVDGLAITDINGDGKQDAVFVVATGSYDDNGTLGSKPAGVYAYLGNGSGGFTPAGHAPGPIVSDDAYSPLNVSDLSNDGRPDVIFNGRHTTEVWTGNGDGTFSAVRTYAVNGNGNAALGDLQGTGHEQLTTATAYDLSTVRTGADPALPPHVDPNQSDPALSLTNAFVTSGTDAHGNPEGVATWSVSTTKTGYAGVLGCVSTTSAAPVLPPAIDADGHPLSHCFTSAGNQFIDSSTGRSALTGAMKVTLIPFNANGALGAPTTANVGTATSTASSGDLIGQAQLGGFTPDANGAATLTWTPSSDNRVAGYEIWDERLNRPDTAGNWMSPQMIAWLPGRGTSSYDVGGLPTEPTDCPVCNYMVVAIDDAGHYPQSASGPAGLTIENVHSAPASGDTGTPTPTASPSPTPTPTAGGGPAAPPASSSAPGPTSPTSPTPLVAPKLGGTAKVGKTVTVATGSWPAGTAVSVRWYLNGKPIPGASHPSLKVKSNYRHKTLTAVIQATQPGASPTTITLKSHRIP